jgi:hypothetical protein
MQPTPRPVNRADGGCRDRNRVDVIILALVRTRGIF